MTPWLLLIFIIHTGDYASIEAPTEAACRQQEAIIRAQAPFPVKTGCYRLAEGV